MSDTKFTLEFLNLQRTMMKKAKTSKSAGPLVQFRAMAVENYPAALDEIEALRERVGMLEAALFTVYDTNCVVKSALGDELIRKFLDKETK